MYTTHETNSSSTQTNKCSTNTQTVKKRTQNSITKQTQSRTQRTHSTHNNKYKHAHARDIYTYQDIQYINTHEHTHTTHQTANK